MCPIVVCAGPAETGKSTTISAVLSLSGGKTNYVKGTNSHFIDRSSQSSLPYGIDDPNSGKKGCSKTNFLDISELIIDLSGGALSGNSAKGVKKPFSVPIIATNHDGIRKDARYAFVTDNLWLQAYMYRIPPNFRQLNFHHLKN